MKSVEAVLMGHINSKTQDISYKLSSELDKVLDQLNNIQQVGRGHDCSTRTSQRSHKLSPGGILESPWSTPVTEGRYHHAAAALPPLHCLPAVRLV